MHRFLITVLVLTTAGLGAFPPRTCAQTEAAPLKEKAMLKVLVHINFDDTARQGHGLKNVQNILKEESAAAIEVVCHGAGITLLVKEKTTHAEQVQGLLKQGVRFVACENTLRDKSIPKENLLPGVVTVPAGVVEIIRKQQLGYGYFKP